jgi:predicted ferric reductase
MPSERVSLKTVLPLEGLDLLSRTQIASKGGLGVLMAVTTTLAVWASQAPSSLGNELSIAAKAFAFSAITLLSVNLLLSTRWRMLEDLFGGLDRLYKVHKLIGKLALWAIIAHLGALIVRRPSAELVVPGLDASITWGILSLALLAILILLTLVARLPYHIWHRSHRLMGVPLALALVHALDAGSDMAAHATLRYWVIAVSLVGLFSYIYTLFLYRRLGPKHSARVARVKEVNDIVEVDLEVDDGMPFHAGQFVFVRFDRLDDGEMYPFSISSGPDERPIRLSIRKAGDFTNRLPELREGDRAMLIGPYGKFGERFLSHEKDMIWIAGGIGITPFLSMAKQESASPTGRRVKLIWSHRGAGDIYDHELEAEARSNGEFTYIHWLSPERGRLDASTVDELTEGGVRGRMIFLCGPVPMMRSIAEGLVRMGVRPRDIVYEDFDLL